MKKLLDKQGRWNRKGNNDERGCAANFPGCRFNHVQSRAHTFRVRLSLREPHASSQRKDTVYPFLNTSSYQLYLFNKKTLNRHAKSSPANETTDTAFKIGRRISTVESHGMDDGSPRLLCCTF